MGGCNSCKTSDTGLPRGCKNNGACSTGSCGTKLQVFDWLANMHTIDNQKTNHSYVVVRFKNDRKAFFQNKDNLPINLGDVVVVSATQGYDIGSVCLKGPLVSIQMRKKKISLTDPLQNILRKATESDIKKWTESRNKEHEVMIQSRIIAKHLNLEMKISDVELRGDGLKATFYYIANDRVDFRKLIKEFAQSFRLKIEMKQIGFRQEAAKIGGLGSCGRELCCSSWLTDFRSINTSAARYQQLSINPQKIAGQCGKLKCCLNYELDVYMDALKDLPSTELRLKTNKGDAIAQKIDIFKKEMWYSYENQPITWHKLSVIDVNKIIALNEKGKKIGGLEDFTNPDKDEKLKESTLSLELKSHEINNSSFSRKKRNKSFSGVANTAKGFQKKNTNNDKKIKPNGAPDEFNKK